MLQQKRLLATALTVTVCVIWLALAFTTAYTRTPTTDEAWYSLPPRTFLASGNWGIREIEPQGWYSVFRYERPLIGLERRTYALMPLPLMIQAAWYKLLGWGLMQQRALSIFFGALGLALWYALVRHWRDDRWVAAAAAVFIGFDWVYLNANALGRPDIMGHTLGLLGLYLYERYYDSAPARCSGAAALCMCAALFTQPNAGFVWGAVWLTRVWARRRKWRLSQFGAMAAAVVFSLGLFGLWVSYDPAAFRAQMLANAAFRAVSPLRGLRSEAYRYLWMYGVIPSINPTLLYGCIPVVCGFTFLLSKRRRWSLPGLTATVIAAGTGILVLGLVDGTKFSQYGIHVAPWFGVIGAYGLGAFAENPRRRPIAGILVGCYVLAACIAVVGSARRNSYRNEFVPAVAALSGLHESGLVFAPPEFRYSYDGPFIYDIRLGFCSGRKAPVMALRKKDISDVMQAVYPLPKAHITRVIDGCRLTFENSLYKVYDCRGFNPISGVASHRSLVP